MAIFKISKLNPWQQKMRMFLMDHYGHICDQDEDEDEFWFFIDGFDEDFADLDGEQDCLRLYHKVEENLFKVKRRMTFWETIEFVELYNKWIEELKELLKK